MSERGWRAFLDAEGVEDWVVLHGGATAVFRVGSLGEAARLAGAVAEVAGLESSGRCSRCGSPPHGAANPRIWALEPRHIELARAVSAVARAHGRSPTVRQSRRSSSRSPPSPTRSMSASGGPCWAMHRWPRTTPSTRSVTDRRSGCRTSTRTSRCGTRCTSTCRSRASKAEARLAAALAAGGRIVDESEAPGTWILADRAGNRVCIAAWPDGSKPPAPDDSA